MDYITLEGLQDIADLDEGELFEAFMNNTTDDVTEEDFGDYYECFANGIQVRNGELYLDIRINTGDAEYYCDVPLDYFKE